MECLYRSWRLLKGVAYAYVICAITVELYIQFWVVRVLSSKTYIDDREMTGIEHLAFVLRAIVIDSTTTFPIAAMTFAATYAALTFSSRFRGFPMLARIAGGLLIGAVAGMAFTAFRLPLSTAINYSIGSISAGAFSVIYLAWMLSPNNAMELQR